MNFEDGGKRSDARQKSTVTPTRDVLSSPKLLEIQGATHTTQFDCLIYSAM
jgi:hypothetical protein